LPGSKKPSAWGTGNCWCYSDGQQRLFAAEEGEAGREIPVQEGVYVEDQGGEISSLKNGHVSIFLIPEGMEVDAAGSGIIKKY